MESTKFSEKELKLIKKMDDNVGHLLLKPEDRNPHFFIRWLRARDLDYAKAESMLLHSIKWRKNNKLEDILEWDPPEVLKKYIPFGILGFEPTGHTVSIIPIGRIDVRGVVESCGKEPIVRYTVKLLDYTFELLKEKSREISRNVDQIIVIIDCEHLGIRHLLYEATIDLVLKLVKIHESNYPESLKHAYIINAPRVFTTIFALIKPILSQHTQNKISIYGLDDKKWKKALLDDIPSEILPPHWGGTMEGVDEFCSNKVCIGGKVPDIYLKNGQESCQNDDFVTLVLGAGEKKSVQIQMPRPNSTFRLTMKLDAYDIRVYLPENEEEKMFIYDTKLDSNSGIISESITCKSQGTYSLTFDNSYSKFRSKTVQYFISKEVCVDDQNQD